MQKLSREKQFDILKKQRNFSFYMFGENTFQWLVATLTCCGAVPLANDLGECATVFVQDCYAFIHTDIRKKCLRAVIYLATAFSV